METFKCYIGRREDIDDWDDCSEIYDISPGLAAEQLAQDLWNDGDLGHGDDVDVFVVKEGDEPEKGKQYVVLVHVSPAFQALEKLS